MLLSCVDAKSYRLVWLLHQLGKGRNVRPIQNPNISNRDAEDKPAIRYSNYVGGHQLRRNITGSTAFQLTRRGRLPTRHM